MEKLKVKHDHSLTDIIKVGIFALFLILPILVFLPNCLYYGFNENATNETTTQINYKYQSNEVNTLDDLVVGNIYHLDNLTIDTGIMSYEDNSVNIGLLKYEEAVNSIIGSIDETSLGTYDSKNGNYLQISIQYQCYYVYFTNATDYAAIYDEDGYVSFSNVDFIYLEQYGSGINDLFSSNLPQYTDYNVIESVETNVDNTITQSVTNAWQRMWETPMLNWTSNNTFQFTINAFTNVFGITQESKMANYLTYLLVITCIYLVFDIVLTLTTKLTHLINAK